MLNGMMDALVKESRAPGLALKRVPIPEPGYGEVLIKIHKTAICGTDLHIYNWDTWSQNTLNPPLTIGHEYVGQIAALGPYVSGLSIGQRVSGEGHIVCGHCRNCRGGNGQWCAHTLGVGVQRDGAFAEYLCLPASNVVPLDKNLPEDVVAFFDAYGNATHTALMFDVAGEDVLVTGAGPIGIMAGAICRKNGARQVVITDMNDYRLGLASRMGLFAVNVKTEKLEDVMRTHAMVEGFDIGLEMSGSPAAFSQMLGHMRNGGKIAMLGIFSRELERFNFNDIIFKGLTVQGVYGRRMFETWYKMSAMVQGGLDLTPVITHRFPYTEYEKGFAAMNSGNSGKVILDWRKP